MAGTPRVAPTPITRKVSGFSNTLFWGSIGVAIAIPIFGPMLSHFVDRWRNRHDTNNELRTRADWYRFQVAKQLGMNPADVTQRDLLRAAELNPQLARSVKEVYNKEGDNNRFSLLTMAGASLVPVAGGGIKAMAMTMGGAIGGGTLASLMTKSRVDPQDVIEVINAQVMAGRGARNAVSPQLVFMLRVAQNDALGKQISQMYGKAFHTMTEAEQTGVMQAYPQLASACASEAYAVSTGVMQVQELMAAPPNMNSMAARYAPSPRSQSFVAQLETDRAKQVANTPSV